MLQMESKVTRSRHRIASFPVTLSRNGLRLVFEGFSMLLCMSAQYQKYSRRKYCEEGSAAEWRS